MGLTFELDRVTSEKYRMDNRARMYHDFVETLQKSEVKLKENSDLTVQKKFTDLILQVEEAYFGLRSLARDHGRSEFVLDLENNLKESQRAWIVYHDASFAFLDMMYRKGVLSFEELEKEKERIVRSRVSGLQRYVYLLELQLGLRSQMDDWGM